MKSQTFRRRGAQQRGVDLHTPVSEDYKVPFKFTGKLEKVTIDLK